MMYTTSIRSDIDDIWDQADAADDDVTWASSAFLCRPAHQVGG